MKKNDHGLEQVLSVVGLDKREAAFYLAALQLGKGLISKVALMAGLNRSASYEVMRALKEKGLVSTTKNTKGLVVVPVDPGQLLNIQQSRLEMLSQHMDQLRYLFTVAQNEPGVRMFEGAEGLRTVLQMALDQSQETCIFGDGDAFKKAIPGWTDDYADRRVKKGIKARLILKATPETLKKLQKQRHEGGDKARLNETRVLPEGMGVVGGFDVFGDTVVLFSFDQKNVAVVIESKVLAMMMRGVFNMLWNMAEVYNRLLLA